MTVVPMRRRAIHKPLQKLTAPIINKQHITTWRRTNYDESSAISQKSFDDNLEISYDESSAVNNCVEIQFRRNLHPRTQCWMMIWSTDLFDIVYLTCANPSGLLQS